MKTKFLFLTILAFLCLSMQAQEPEEMQTVFGKKDGKTDHGGYGAFTIGYNKIDDKDAMVMGGRAGWLIDHHFTLGLVGYGFFNNVSNYNNSNNNSEDYAISGGYGGLFFEPIFMPNRPVHIAVPVVFGVGGATANPGNWDDDNWDYYNYDSDVFLVFEPGVEVEFNIMRFFRIAVGSTYRWTNGIDLVYEYYDYNNQLQVKHIGGHVIDSFTFNMSFKFGWF